MKRWNRLSCLLALAGCATTTARPDPAPAPAPAPPARPTAEAPPAPAARTVTEVVAEVIEKINAGELAALHARFSPELQAVAPLPALRQIVGSMLGERGRLTGATAIEADERAGSFTLNAERGAWKLRIALGDDDIITGFGVSEPDAAAPPVVRSAAVSLPFRGEWLVYWGGDRPEHNHHVNVPSQRRAADLVIVDAAGSSHRGDGRALTDYYAYGQDILAMADGVVVTAIDGVPDSVPGEPNPFFVTGNLVILRHSDAMYSVYAHLVPGSLAVKPGQRVRRGQRLAACGNSGHSTEPHLHVQLQDGPRFEASWGLEAVFGEAVVVRDGARAVRSDYSFLKGDRVSPPPSARVTTRP